MALFGRKQVIAQQTIENGLIALGYEPDGFRLSTEHAGDHVKFTAKSRNLVLHGVLSSQPDGWVRISVSPETVVGRLQSRTMQLPPVLNGWYE